jgi:VCBS repeat-containing protein
MRRVRLVIADRRPIVLQGFASLFAAEFDFEVVASCLNGASCLEAVRNLTPDVVLVEDGFSDVTASEMLAAAKAENLPSRLVFYTATVARGDLAVAIAAGACNAISMRAKPETVLQSLRLVAPRPDRAPASKGQNGAFGDDVLAALTDEQRKVMRLVAYGMSNKEIARQLNIPPSTIKAHLDHIFQKLQINNRTELAPLVLSRLSGGIGALAALIFAALDDVHAHPNAVGHTFTDTFTVMAADGAAEVTIVINPKKSSGASSATAKTMVKAGRTEDPAAGTPTPSGKFVASSVDITASTITSAAFSSARPSSGSYGTLMMAAAGVWIYELDFICNAAQAFDLGDSPTDAFVPATANGTKELVNPNTSSRDDVNLNGSGTLAWLYPETFDQSFAFGVFQGDVELQTINPDAGEDSANGNGNNYSHGGSSETINASIDRGGFGDATAADASQAHHGTIQANGGHDANHGQSQRDLQASEDGSAAGKQHPKHDPPGHDANHGQSQRDLQASEDGSAAGKQHAEHDPPGHDANHGQSQRDLQASEVGSAAGKQHAKHDPPGHDPNQGQSQRDLNASKAQHSEASLNAKGEDKATDNTGQAEATTTPNFGDSFHFKNDMEASKPSDDFELNVGHGSEHGPHNAGNDGLALIQDADLLGISLPQHAVDHAKGAEHHLTHDLFV